MNIRGMLAIVKDTFSESISSKSFYVLIALSTLIAVILLGLKLEPSVSGAGMSQVDMTFWGYQLPQAAGVTAEDIQVNILLVLANKLGGLIGLITAIVVTASFVPRMFQKGTIELYLSRPIGRYQILLAKYMGGLSFVFVQSVWLVSLIFIAFGARSGIWSFRFLWAIPVLTFLFAVLYAFSVLMAVLWRKTGLVILLTIGFWIICGTLGTAREAVQGMLFYNTIQQKSLRQFNEKPKNATPSPDSGEDQKMDASGNKELAGLQETETTLLTVQKWLLRATYVLPPTSELDQVAQSLYTGKGAIKISSGVTVEVDSPPDDVEETDGAPDGQEPTERHESGDSGSERSMPNSMENQDLELKIDILRPLLTCFGFVVFCLGLASFIFHRKEI